MVCKSGSFPGAINTGIRYANASRVGLLLANGWLKEEAIAECLGHDADMYRAATETDSFWPNS